MRTTVNLPDDVYELARSLAHSKNLSMGDALAALVRNGVRPVSSHPFENGFPIFTVAPDALPITLERTLDLEDGL